MASSAPPFCCSTLTHSLSATHAGAVRLDGVQVWVDYVLHFLLTVEPTRRTHHRSPLDDRDAFGNDLHLLAHVSGPETMFLRFTLLVSMVWIFSVISSCLLFVDTNAARCRITDENNSKLIYTTVVFFCSSF